MTSPNDDLIAYDLDGQVATITMDDGKANAQSPAMLDALAAAFDRAEDDEAVVVLRGRPGMFSGGYDLKVFQSGDGDGVTRMLRGGGGLVHRMLTFPRPVLAACTGHAIAQGTFVLAAADTRIGVAGDFRFGMNEVALGLAVPHYAVAVSRHRMHPAALDHALGTGEFVGPAQAQQWGLLDHVVDAEEFDDRVAAEAARLSELVPYAVTETRRRVRGDLADRIRAAIDDEFPAPEGS